MNLRRIVCFALGGAGIAVAAFAAILDKRFGVFFYGAPILGIPLFLAMAARPRKWFSEPEAQFDGENADYDPDASRLRRDLGFEFGRFGIVLPESSISDYIMLLVILVGIAVFMPGNRSGWIYTDLFSVLLIVVIWQLRAFPGLVGLLTLVGTAIYGALFPQRESYYSLIAVTFINVGGLSLMRWSIRSLLNRVD